VASTGSARFHADRDEHRKLLERFLTAVTSGELEDLEDLLAEDVVAYSDGGGKVRAALRPLLGPSQVCKLYRGIARRVTFGPESRIVEANGVQAALFRVGQLTELLFVDVTDHRIRTIYGIVNPDKLSYFERQLTATGA
jgi:RNA polymerase sigma-70 factor (ECF subfamily)